MQKSSTTLRKSQEGGSNTLRSSNGIQRPVSPSPLKKSNGTSTTTDSINNFSLAIRAETQLSEQEWDNLLDLLIKEEKINIYAPVPNTIYKVENSPSNLRNSQISAPTKIESANGDNKTLLELSFPKHPALTKLLLHKYCVGLYANLSWLANAKLSAENNKAFTNAPLIGAKINGNNIDKSSCNGLLKDAILDSDQLIKVLLTGEIIPEHVTRSMHAINKLPIYRELVTLDHRIRDEALRTITPTRNQLPNLSPPSAMHLYYFIESAYEGIFGKTDISRDIASALNDIQELHQWNLNVSPSEKLTHLYHTLGNDKEKTAYVEKTIDAIKEAQNNLSRNNKPQIINNLIELGNEVFTDSLLWKTKKPSQQSTKTKTETSVTQNSAPIARPPSPNKFIFNPDWRNTGQITLLSRST